MISRVRDFIGGWIAAAQVHALWIGFALCVALWLAAGIAMLEEVGR